MKKIKDIINKLLNAKTVDLDQDGKVESIRDEISGLLGNFQQIYDKIEDANDRLEEVVEKDIENIKYTEHRLEELANEYRQEIENYKNRIKRANNDISANKVVKEKIADFLPNQQ